MKNGPEVDLIKKPYRKLAYTAEQIKEFKKCAHPKTGPLYFLKHYFYVQHPTKGKILYNPFD